MRILILTLLSVFTVMAGFAQKFSTETLDELINKGELDKAKEQVDKALANSKLNDKPEPWFYKCVVYNQIAKDEKHAALLNGADGRMEAFNAYKKYLELDPKNVRGTLNENVWLFDIYNGYYDIAATSFNNQKFEEALANFKKAYEIEKFVASKKFVYGTFSFPDFDTSMIQNLAAAAYKANKLDESLGYYEQIAAAGITGDDYITIYQFLVEQYGKKNDKANYEKYLALGQKLYPDNYYWIEVQLDACGEEVQKRLSCYETLSQKYPDSYLLHYNYAVELFNYAYTTEPKPADYKQIQVKLEQMLKKAKEINKESNETNLLMTRHLYNVTFDIQEEQRSIKGQTPADKKKREDLRASMMVKFDELIPYATACYDHYKSKKDLKASEKGNYRLVIQILADCYEMKKMPEKSDEFRAALKNVN